MEFKHPIEETINKTFDFSKNPLYAGNNIRTSSGIYINVFDIENQIDKINIEDIAHALSFQCRFSGHIQTFYSVAQHSIHVSELVPIIFRLPALMHDASEAYLADLAKPIKILPEFNFFVEIENKIQEAICKHFGMSIGEPPSVKKADKRL
jgi:hypothetical protein